MLHSDVRQTRDREEPGGTAFKSSARLASGWSSRTHTWWSKRRSRLPFQRLLLPTTDHSGPFRPSVAVTTSRKAVVLLSRDSFRLSRSTPRVVAASARTARADQLYATMSSSDSLPDSPKAPDEPVFAGITFHIHGQVSPQSTLLPRATPHARARLRLAGLLLSVQLTPLCL